MDKNIRQELIESFSQAIEKTKRHIVILDADQHIPFKIKHQRIHNLRCVLNQSQRVLLILLQEEVNEQKRAG